MIENNHNNQNNENNENNENNKNNENNEKNQNNNNEDNSNDNNIKIPKKRGRKPRIKNPEEENVVKIPKKRGRKPKIKIENEQNINKFVLPSKRGRKPKDKIYGVNKNLKNNLNDLYILHLPISYQKIKTLLLDEPYSYNPNLELPNAFDPYIKNENLLDNSDLEENNNLHTLKNDNKDDQLNSDINNKLLNDDNENIEDNFSTNMLVKFSEYSKKYNKLPDETNNKCFWCLHGFSNEIFGLPLKINNNEFEMYGCFCSPQCVVSFNFQELNDDFSWERYSYINYLYNNTNDKIYPAPSRLVLTMFGGELSIEQFRNITDKKYNANILLPPLISIIPQLEVYKSNFITNNQNYIPLNNDRINKYNELKLKRDKPLIDKKNNLESSLKLVYI